MSADSDGRMSRHRYGTCILHVSPRTTSEARSTSSDGDHDRARVERQGIDSRSPDGRWPAQGGLEAPPLKYDTLGAHFSRNGEEANEGCDSISSKTATACRPRYTSGPKGMSVILVAPCARRRQHRSRQA